MTCECGNEHSTAVPGVTASPIPEKHFYHSCQCGCLELRERVAILEQNLYQLTLIVQNREKAGLDSNDNYIARREQDIKKPRWIGDKGPNA